MEGDPYVRDGWITRGPKRPWSTPIRIAACACGRVAIAYDRFPIVEWTAYFKNEGSQPSGVLEKIAALDVALSGTPGNDIVLRHPRGSFNSELDFEPRSASLRRDSTERIASAGGRGTDEEMPLFNLDWGGCGAILALGWPGQWETTFTARPLDRHTHRPADRRVSTCACWRARRSARR